MRVLPRCSLIAGKADGLDLLPLPRAATGSRRGEVEGVVEHVRGKVGGRISDEEALAAGDEHVVSDRVVSNVLGKRQLAVSVAFRVILEKRIVVNEAVLSASALRIAAAHEHTA